MAGRDESVAPAHLMSLERGEVDGDALTRLRALDRQVVDLDAADAHHSSRGLEPQQVASGRRARPECPGCNRADSAETERTVEVQARRTRRAPLLHLDPRERRSQLVEASSRSRGDRDDLGTGHQVARLVERELERLRVDGVRLRHGDDTAVDAEQAKDREMLVRLRPSTLLRVDDEQKEVDPGRAGDHHPHEALVPGDVDERQAPATRQLERRIAEVDRDAARSAPRGGGPCPSRERAHEPGLAVVDVAGGADGQRHARTTAAATASSSSSASVRQSSSRRPSRTIADTGGSRGAERRPRAPLRSRRRTTAAPRAAARRRRRARRSPRPRRRPPRRAARRARGPTPAALVRASAAPARRAARGRVEVERAAFPRARRGSSLSMRSARCSGCRRSCSTRSARPTTIPACGPPSSLSPLKQTRSAPAGERVVRGRLVAEVDERAGAEIVEERQLVPAGDGGELAQRSGARRSRRRGSSTGGRAGATRCRRRPRARSRPRACGSSFRPRRAARPSARARRGCGSRRRSRSARHARRAPRGPRRARRARAAARPRCC